jgi:hypothetical protein
VEPRSILNSPALFLIGGPVGPEIKGAAAAGQAARELGIFSRFVGIFKSIFSVETKSAVTFDVRRTNYIFREALGHVNPATLEEREQFVRLFEEVGSNSANLRPDFHLPQQAVEAGVQAYTKVLESGEQAWVYVREGKIVEAGINPPGAFR